MNNAQSSSDRIPINLRTEALEQLLVERGLVDPQVMEATSNAAKVFEELGCHLDDAGLALEAPFDAFETIFGSNAIASYGGLMDTHPDQLTEYVREWFEDAAQITGHGYARALGQVDRLKARFDDLFDEYDLLLSPTMAVPAFPVGEPPKKIGGKEVDPSRGYTPFTSPINMIGHTAASIPCGFSSDGLPIGLHVIGRRGDEETVIAASAAFERARPWIQRRPSVS